MLAELLQLIYDKAESRLHPIPHLRMTGRRTRVVTINGQEKTETIEPEYKPITRYVTSLTSFCELFGAFVENSPTVFVDHNRIIGLPNDADRSQLIVLNMLQSAPLSCLIGLEDGVAQKTLISHLRTVLDGCVMNEQLLATVRSLTFESHRHSRGVVDKTQESFGRSIEQQARTGIETEIPEKVRVMVPYWDYPSDFVSTLHLECAVSLDFDKETIALEPIGNLLAREQSRVLDEVVGRLSEHLAGEATVVAGSVTFD